jgi:hypothetical protein
MKAELVQAYNMIRSGNFKLSYVIDYLVGNFRYKALEPGIDYSEFKNGVITFDESKAPMAFLIRKGVIMAFKERLSRMNALCKMQLSCVHCGCEVPHLQLSNRKCETCYDDMKTMIKNLNKPT